MRVAREYLNACPAISAAIALPTNSASTMDTAKSKLSIRLRTNTRARGVPVKAEHKLLQTAELDLPIEGNWKIYVSVNRSSQTAGFVLPIHVARQPTTLEHLHLWPYVVLAIFFAIFLAVNVRRHTTGRPEIARVERVNAIPSSDSIPDGPYPRRFCKSEPDSGSS